ncbi:MAG: RICIN domain-containing protein [Clostridia bacterium]|nr:RICIN domain-containing protein [Clostridia bacterium]
MSKTGGMNSNKKGVRLLKKIALSVTTAAVAASSANVVMADTPQKVYWQCTTESNRWVDMGSLETTAWDDDTSLYIDVDQTTRYQTLTDTPWGGCFADRGWEAMKDLSEESRDAIMRDLFSDDGLRLTVGRMPIGNNDFSINRSQSYDELPEGVNEDYDLEYFSIDIDRTWLIPYMRAALKYRPDLKFWGSPWSPPSWMKTNKTIHSGGSLIWEEDVLRTYAMYFAKYIEAYRAEGFDIYMVMPQNEPTMNTAYASCVWTGEQLNEFIRDYLAPTLKERNLDTQIYLGTFTDSQANRVDPTLNDPVTSALISGVGFQWWSAPLAKRVYRQATSLSLMQSETKCGSGNNSWIYAEEQFDCMKEFFDAGVNSYMLWNMVLDEKGENTSPSPWRQNAPIIVHSETSAVSYSPQYHQFKHFSYYVDGGARRIKTDGNYGDKIAFQNADGEIVLVVKNSSNSALDVAINFNGSKIKPTVPAHSINTFRLAGDNSDFATSPDMAQSSGSDEDVDTMVKFHNLKGGKTLSINSASFDNGARAISWTDQGTADQTWIIEPIDDGYCHIVNFNSLKALGIYAGSVESGARAVQWTLDGTPNQDWSIVPVLYNGRTYYRIDNRGSGLCLAFENGSELDAATAVQVEYTGDVSQLWEAIVIQGDALKSLSPLEISGVSQTASTVYGTLRCNNTGDYVLRCASYDESGTLLSVTSEKFSLEPGETVDFALGCSETGTQVVCYGWKRQTLVPAAEKITLSPQ